MQINNRKNIIAIKIRQLFVTILLIAVLTVLYTTGLVRGPVLGLEINHLAMIAAGLYILFILYQFLMEWNFIYYSDEGEKIIFRYYSIKPTSKKTQSIEIPKSAFLKYSLERKKLFLQPRITLYQKLREGIGRFPSISIAALNHKDIKNLRESLDRYVKR